MFSIGKPKVSPKPHQNYCTDVFLKIFTIIVEDLYFTEHYTVAVYLNFTDLQMQRMFHCGNCPFSRKFNLHVVYIFEFAWNSVTLFWHSDQRVNRNSPSLLYCMFAMLACLQVCVLDVLACLHALHTRVLMCWRL